MHEVTYIDVEQGTELWLKEKLGLMSASEAYNLLNSDRYGKPAAGYRNYRAKLLMERLTGISPDRFKTKQMEYGTETEGVARMMYSLTTGNVARQSGIYKIEGKNACASLDGEFEENGRQGILEIKNREISNHIESIATDKVPDMYYKQIQFQLWVTNKDFGDYDSYCDEMPDNAKQFIKRVERDEEVIKQIEERYEMMEADIAKYTKIIQAYKGTAVENKVNVAKVMI